MTMKLKTKSKTKIKTKMDMRMNKVSKGKLANILINMREQKTKVCKPQNLKGILLHYIIRMMSKNNSRLLLLTSLIIELRVLIMTLKKLITKVVLIILVK